MKRLAFAMFVLLAVAGCGNGEEDAVKEMTREEVISEMQFCLDIGLKGKIIYDQETSVITRVICLNDFEQCADDDTVE